MVNSLSLSEIKCDYSYVDFFKISIIIDNNLKDSDITEKDYLIQLCKLILLADDSVTARK